MNTLPPQLSRPASSSRTRLFPRNVLVLLSLVLLPLTASAATYYFSDIAPANDANSGLDSTVPKRSLAEAERLAIPGNTLLFRRNGFWYDSQNTFDLQNIAGTASNPVIIDAYPAAGSITDRPVIAALRKLNDAVGVESNQWKLVPAPAPAGLWQQSVGGFSHALRLFVSNVSKYQVNRSDQCADQSAVNATHEWYLKPVEPGSSGILYVYTGSNTAAPQNTEIHPMGAVTTLKIKNSSHVTIRNIDFRGGSASEVIMVDAPCSNITFDNCTIQRANGSGIVVTNSGSVTTDVVANITIKNCRVDKIWTTFENDPNITLRGDGIFLLHAVQDGLIQNNDVYNWGHSGITLTSYREGFHGVHDVIVEENDVSAVAAGYMHAFDVSGFENLTTDNIIRRNFFHDFQATCHAMGNHNKFYSNIFARVTLTTMPKHSKQPYGIDMMPWPIPRFKDDPNPNWIVAHDNLVAHNTFYDVEQYPIMVADSAANPYPVNNNLFYNNLIVGYANPPPGNETNPPDVGLRVSWSVTGNIYSRYNNFWDYEQGAQAGSTVVARYKNVAAPEFTASGLNAAFPSFCTGNSQHNSTLGNPSQNQFHLGSAAAAILKASNNPLDPALGVTHDYFNVPFNTANPSIGAIQSQ